MFNASKFHWEKRKWKEAQSQTNKALLRRATMPNWMNNLQRKQKQNCTGKKNIMWKFSEKCTYQHMRNRVGFPCLIVT